MLARHHRASILRSLAGTTVVRALLDRIWCL
jgi:hypothetical protein